MRSRPSGLSQPARHRVHGTPCASRGASCQSRATQALHGCTATEPTDRGAAACAAADNRTFDHLRRERHHEIGRLRVREKTCSVRRSGVGALPNAIHSSQEVALVTDLREETFAKGTPLPDDEQEAFARWLLNDLESERQQWSRSFKASTAAARQSRSAGSRRGSGPPNWAARPNPLCSPRRTRRFHECFAP